jgi:hypothetical protein
MYHSVSRKRNDSNEAPEPTTDDQADEDSSSPKKERVLHTRVPAVLEQELKRFARNLRQPVSNVVRVILEDALKVADRASADVEQRLRNAVDVVATERDLIKKQLKTLDPLDDVLGFQPLVLAQPCRCVGCGASLRRGENGWLGLTAEPGRRVIVCSSCVPPPNDGADSEPPDSNKEN